MKHQEMKTAAEEYLSQLNIELPDVILDHVIAHLLWVLETSQRLNLTSITAPEAGVRLHVVDSLAVLPELLQAPSGLALDLGTGGGFPGIPLAIASERDFTLLDSVAKKAAAVGDYAVQQRMDRVHVVPERSEAHARTRGGAYAVVVARAVAALPSLVELASPLLLEGGELLAMKGALGGEELARGDAAAARVGMKRVSVREYELPGQLEQRSIAVYRKSGKSSVQLPRREGQAQRQPLA